MEWRFSLKMEINKFLKIGFFVIITSILFTACANKANVKNVKKVDQVNVKSISDILNDSNKSFEYDTNQKLYKNKSTKIETTNNLLTELGKLCSDNKGKFVSMNYYINKNYVNSYPNNKASVCEVNNEAYFITHQANTNDNIYYSVSIDEKAKKIYQNFKNHQFEITPAIKEDTQTVIKERQEIIKREASREQKTKLLFNKKDQKAMTFFDSWRYSGKEAPCSKKCTDLNKRSTGYSTLKEAVNNNWQLVSKTEEIEEAIDDSCTCSGYSVLVKKLPTESK